MVLSITRDIVFDVRHGRFCTTCEYETNVFPVQLDWLLVG
jgi:hypothetical protein